MDFAYLYTSLEGRINRKPYWIATLILLAISIPVQLIALYMVGMAATVIIGLIFLYPGFALAVKRAKDRNRPIWLVAGLFAVVLISNFMQAAGAHETAAGEPTGIFLVVSLVLLVYAIYMLVELGFLRGTVGPNQYGPDPLENQ